MTAARSGVCEVLVEDVNEVCLNIARQMGATLAANFATEKGRATEIDFVTGIRKEHRVAMSFAKTPDLERSLKLVTSAESTWPHGPSKCRSKPANRRSIR